MKFNYYMPTRILFGSGSVAKLKRAGVPGKRALLITGGTSTTKLGYVDRVREVLQEAGAESVIYDQVQPNPVLENVKACAEMIQTQGCDFVVGLGGGSAIDTAKAAAVLAANPGELWDYVFGGSGKKQKMPNKPLPVVAITTTAGTGTEVDPWFVITNGEEKIGSGNDWTFPAIAVVDPDFMMTVPPKMTAYQGFDALFHAVEGYLARIANPMSDLYALESIKLLGRSLVQAVKNGQDKQARAEVALANTLSGFVETTSSCTSEHAIEHALSAYQPSLPHGAGLIMISLAYHKRFLQVCPERYIQMAQALGMENASCPEDFLTALAKLQKDCGVDQLKMSEYGLQPEHFAQYVQNARKTGGGLFSLDRQELSDAMVMEILKESYR